MKIIVLIINYPDRFFCNLITRSILVLDPRGGQERMGPRSPPWVPLLKSYGSSILSTSLGSKTVNNTSSLGLWGTKT